MVAGVAGCHHVSQVFGAHVARNHMINGQIERLFSTVLAGVMIAAENFTARETHMGARAANHHTQPDDGRFGKLFLTVCIQPRPLAIRVAFSARINPSARCILQTLIGSKLALSTSTKSCIFGSDGKD
jgi:hypothetical protein